MTTVALLAAGYGTRLRPLTDERPKALVPIGDRPVIAHQVDVVRQQLGTISIVANAHHRATDIESYLQSYDPAVGVSVEEQILGTAGGLRRILKASHEGSLLVVNVDVMSDVNYREILGVVERESAVLRVAPAVSGQGPVGVDAEGYVVRLRQEKFGLEAESMDYLGVAAFGSEVLRSLPATGCLVADFLIPLLRRGVRVRALAAPCRWVDIGTIVAYARANLEWPQGHSPQDSSWVGSGARVIPSVTLERSIVGAGARVHGQGSLTRVIVWPGAEVSAPLRDAIVTSRGVIVAVPVAGDD